MISSDSWHQRWHPLRQEWVVYSAHRSTRPWVGQTESQSTPVPAFDPDCYLCPGNERSGGHVNPEYNGVFVFDNDHPVVSPDAPAAPETGGFYRASQAHGIARVICYDKRHDLTLTKMPLSKVTPVFAEWRKQTRELGALPEIKFVLVFENRGEVVGTSSPHPHCQLYATNFVFKNVELELEALAKEPDIFEQIVVEERVGQRMVAENEYAFAFVPFFARYPYEVWIMPKKRHADMRSVTDAELGGLADVYLQVTRRFDGLFGIPFPFVMSLYQAPMDGTDYDHYHLHFVFLPPLRQPGIQKFPAGPEIGGGNFMNDTRPEQKAAELRAVQLPEDTA